jgi:hypothetical protein
MRYHVIIVRELSVGNRYTCSLSERKNAEFELRVFYHNKMKGLLSPIASHGQQYEIEELGYCLKRRSHIG